MTPAGLARLKLDEGFEAEAYPDPLSGGDPWTIGYGATGPGIFKGVVWTETQAANDLAARLAVNEGELTDALPWFGAILNTPRGDVLENMAYNLGCAGLLEFKHTLASIEVGAYITAAAQMLESTWANQVKARAQRLSDLMASGAYPE